LSNKYGTVNPKANDAIAAATAGNPNGWSYYALVLLAIILELAVSATNQA